MNAQIDLHHAVSDCPNCGANVSGNFCHQCGQETVLHPPSTREFLHEFIGHYVALEGKLWKSLGLLLFRPGRLTLEYIKGRRVRYVQPLRLYLTFSLIFFAVMKYGGHDGVSAHDKADRAHQAPPATAQAHGDAAAPSPEQKSADKKARKAAIKAMVLQEDRPGEIEEGSTDVRAWMRSISPHLGDKADQFAAMSGEERSKAITSAFYSYVPYAIFFMMPVVALYLKMLYLGSGRRYGEHLLFALHANAFAFLAMTLMMLTPQMLGLAVPVLGLWLTFYLPTAMRTVYGGSRILTSLRWIVLMVLHLVTVFLAGFAAVAFGLLH